MKIRVEVWLWIVAAGCLSLLPGRCRAQNICPWLNTATASGVLGGAATVEVNDTGGNTGSCLFRLQNETGSNTLRIAVREVNIPRSADKEISPNGTSCTSPEIPLKGVGNEAILCSVDVKSSRGERVIGRVRNRMFTVVIGAGQDSNATQDSLAKKVEEIARQVAGALF